MQPHAIDADWAWQPWSPTEQQPWNLQTAAHLYRRATFGATLSELRAAAADTPAAVIDRLLNAAEPEAFQQQSAALAAAALASGSFRQLAAWWCHRMLHSPAACREKLTLFWHGHFATSAAKVTEPRLMLAQNELFRRLALGDFQQLVLEVSRDPAMLIYLDSATSRKAHPNENFARELMELFCLGEGQYTEQDIRELARCFTGWEIKRGRFRINRYQQDTGSKTILGLTGQFDGDAGVRIVLQQNSAADFLASRLIRFFVMDEPAASPALIAPLAATLRQHQLQLRPALQQLLSSNLFFSQLARGRRVRSPVELALGMLRSLEGSANLVALSEQLQTLGQGLFYPPSVKGWDGGRTWINSSTLLGRANLVRQLLQDEHTRFGGDTLATLLQRQQLRNGAQIVDALETLLLAVPLPEAARERIARLLDAPGPAAGRLTTGLHTLCTLPEFQLC